MKLIRFGAFGADKPGVQLEDGTRVDLSAHFRDWDRAFFNDDGLEKLAKVLHAGKNLPEIAPQERLGSCIARPGKVVCIGVNYADHAAEAGLPLPSEPIVFLKASNTVVGPCDSIIIPRNSRKTDWEIELGVVIGKDARYLPAAAAAVNHVAGYCIVNDLSEREFQLERGGQWTKGKSCDNFCPVGPFLATRDEIQDVSSLQMRLWVNGELRQNGNTATMVFDVMTVIHYLSQFMTLEAGDLISTGTPPGVGMGLQPPRYLRAGDNLELEIEGLGRQRSACVAE